jgi:hypothetical protein
MGGLPATTVPKRASRFDKTIPGGYTGAGVLSAYNSSLSSASEEERDQVDKLQSLPPIQFGAVPFLLNISCLFPTYVCGEAYLAAGHRTHAAAEFQKILDHRELVWNCWTGSLAHLGVARAKALQPGNSQPGDASAARVRALAAYKDSLTFWKDADPDIPLLKQAKAEHARCNGFCSAH